MGQKVHPFGFRLGYNKNWQSRWFSKKEYPAFVYEDSKIRAFVKKHERRGIIDRIITLRAVIFDREIFSIPILQI